MGIDQHLQWRPSCGCERARALLQQVARALLQQPKMRCEREPNDGEAHTSHFQHASTAGLECR